MKRSEAFRFFAVCCLAASLQVPAWADNIKSADAIVKALSAPAKTSKGADGKMFVQDPTLDLEIAFEFNKSSLTQAGKMQLDQLALAFQNPALAQGRFEIAGHTDRVGSHEFNIKLSTNRAVAVRDYLNRQHRVPLERMLTQGYGFTHLADPTNPTSPINRRVEIRHLVGQAYGAGIEPYMPQPVVPPPQPQVQPQMQTYPQPVPATTVYPAPTGGQLVPR